MYISSGKLNNCINLLKPTITKDEFGAETTVYEVLPMIKANVKYNSGNRITEQNEVIHSFNVTFTIRSPHQLDFLYRISYKDRLYRILDFYEDILSKSIVITTGVINE